MSTDVAALVVERGVIRLVRKMAAFAYGRREVTWPEDYEGPEKQLPDDRTFGYVAALPGDGRPLGLSERRFVRADVQIDAVDKWSNVERVLDDAAARTGGEVFVESLIEGRSLGNQVPGRDFKVGDRVPARVAGRVLPGQLVTGVEWRDGKPAVKLGGQEWQNAQARQDRNDGVLRQIANERRQRERALAQEAERRQAAAEREASARELALSQESNARVTALLEEAEQRRKFQSYVSADYNPLAPYQPGAYLEGVLDSASAQSSAQITSALGPIKSDLSAVRSTASSAYSRASSANTRIDNLWLSGTGKELKDAKAQYDKDLKQIQTTLGGDRNFQNAFSNELWKLDEQARQMGVQSPEQLQGAFEKYRTINTALWQNQKVLDARQDAMIATTDRRVPLMFAFRSRMSTSLGDISLPDGNFSFQKKPGWSGYLAVICHVKAANSYSFSNAWEVGYWDTGPYSSTTRTLENVESGLLIIARK